MSRSLPIAMVNGEQSKNVVASAWNDVESTVNWLRNRRPVAGTCFVSFQCRSAHGSGFRNAKNIPLLRPRCFDQLIATMWTLDHRARFRSERTRIVFLLERKLHVLNDRCQAFLDGPFHGRIGNVNFLAASFSSNSNNCAAFNHSLLRFPAQ